MSQPDQPFDINKREIHVGDWVELVKNCEYYPDRGQALQRCWSGMVTGIWDKEYVEVEWLVTGAIPSRFPHAAHCCLKLWEPAV